MNISKGLIKNFYEDNYYKIRHLCNESHGSRGGPLIDKYNLKIIGAPIWSEEKKEFNLGIFSKFPIKDSIDYIINKI